LASLLPFFLPEEENDEVESILLGAALAQSEKTNDSTFVTRLDQVPLIDAHSRDNHNCPQPTSPERGRNQLHVLVAPEKREGSGRPGQTGGVSDNVTQKDVMSPEC
jgi:hypothetical protein